MQLEHGLRVLFKLGDTVQTAFCEGLGNDVTLTPVVLNDIVGTSPDTDPLVLTELNIGPHYRAIRHTLWTPVYGLVD